MKKTKNKQWNETAQIEFTMNTVDQSKIDKLVEERSNLILNLYKRNYEYMKKICKINEKINRKFTTINYYLVIIFIVFKFS